MVSVPGRDKLDFYSRRETKYELDAKGAGEMRRIVEDNLPRYEFREGRPSTFITTVYFDTDHLDFYEHASRHYDNNKKIRVKEYYYELEDGSEETFPYCFVEIKKRREGRVGKRRLLVPKKLLGRILKGEDVWEELVRAEPGIEFNGADSTFRQLRHYLDEISERSLINYRRSVYQENRETEDELRITFDDRLNVFEPVEGMYESVDALTFHTLGEPIKSVNKVIMEIKTQSSYPEWLGRALKDFLPKKMSKFTTSINLLGRELLPGESRNPEKPDDARGNESSGGSPKNPKRKA